MKLKDYKLVPMAFALKQWRISNDIVEDDDLTITPELQAKIDKARQEYKEGKTTTIRTHEELDAFLESL